MALLEVAMGIVVGFAVGASTLYVALRALKREVKPKVTIPTALPRPRAEEVLIPTQELERARRELKTMLLEKELLAGALTRVYEAEAQNKITREEREQLSRKYRDQLKAIEEKLGDTELLIEVGGLENLREELVSLFERKIEQIDSRLQQVRARLEEVRPISKAPPPVEVEVKERKKAKAEEVSVDGRVKALREEVLQALARLEQMDIEGE